MADNGKGSASGQTKKPTDVMLIVIIILLVIAIISFVITIGILFGFSGKGELADQRSALLAAGAMFLIAIVLSVVTAILLFMFMNAKKAGKPTKSLGIALLVIGIATGIFLMIGLVLTFVTANQINDTNPSEASGLRAAGAFGLIGFVFFVIAFILFLVRRSRNQDIAAGGKGNYRAAGRNAFGYKQKAAQA